MFDIDSGVLSSQLKNHRKFYSDLPLQVENTLQGACLNLVPLVQISIFVQVAEYRHVHFRIHDYRESGEHRLYPIIG